MEEAEVNFSRCLFTFQEGDRPVKAREDVEDPQAGTLTDRPIVIDGTFADMQGFVFPGNASFESATFEGYPCFDSAIFQGNARFNGVTFQHDAAFDSTIFQDDSWFGNAIWKGDASFYCSMRNCTTTKSAPSSAAWGSAVVEKVPPHPPRPQDALGQATDDIAPHIAQVEQDEVVDDHPVLQVAQPVDEFGGVGAPSPDDGHLCPHAAQRNIRPCPTSRLPSPPCSRSTAATRRPMSSSCPVTVRCSVGPGSVRATTSSSASRACGPLWRRL